MGFRKKRNRREEWTDFVANNAALIDSTLLPQALFINEAIFVDFVSTGEFRLPDGGRILRLTEMNDPEFLELESVINEFFFDGWWQKTLTIFYAERLRRFERYG